MVNYFQLAFRNLKRRGIRSYLTLLGIFIGIAAVVSLITLGAGLKSAVMSQFGISSTEVISVQAGGLNSYGPPGSGAINPLTIEDVEAIDKLGIVEKAIRRNVPSGKLEFNNLVGFGFATNILDGDDRRFIYKQIDAPPIAGRLLKDGDTNKVVLGYNFYVDKAGFGKPIKIGDSVLIQDKKFEVIGITEQKGSFIFDNIVYMNEKPLNDLMGYGDKVDIIAVKIKDKDLMDKAKEDIEKLMRKRRNVKQGEEDFEVSTPDAALATVNDVLGAVQAFIIIIASISILVGAIGIINTMTTSVLERRREIGIMKAIGAKNKHIFFQFLVESGLLGLVGGLAGALVGMFIGYLGTVGINSFLGASAQPQINIILLLLTLAGSFIIGAIAGITPAMQAAKQNPVDALQS